MNFKERIELIKQIKKTSDSNLVDIKSDFDVSSLFVKNALIDQILKNAFLKNKNIILLCPSYIDRTLVANYIRNIVPETSSIEVFKSVSDDISFSVAEKIIITEVSYIDVSKLLGMILTGLKTFVFSLNLKSFENVLESFRTIISLNNPNLSQNNIEHLIGMAEPFFVYIDRNEDGLYTITDVAKVVYKNNVATIELLFGDKEMGVEESIIPVSISETEEKIEEVVLDVQGETSLETPMEVEEPIVLTQPIVLDEPVKVKKISPDVKINKYKLLKEKIKNKKQ